jgi:hypothetical protein
MDISLKLDPTMEFLKATLYSSRRIKTGGEF